MEEKKKIDYTHDTFNENHMKREHSNATVTIALHRTTKSSKTRWLTAKSDLLPGTVEALHESVVERVNAPSLLTTPGLQWRPWGLGGRPRGVRDVTRGRLPSSAVFGCDIEISCLLLGVVLLVDVYCSTRTTPALQGGHGHSCFDLSRALGCSMMSPCRPTFLNMF